ncbi:MAG: T9SS type A sorting domain-containing protein [Candidatus Stahlbacteria bacterium]|nr:T9SS type A sorting domain-containing protein [Candidatus Stahlbacteria bacterium]
MRRLIKIAEVIIFLGLGTKSLSAQNNLELVSKVCANAPLDVARCGNYLYVVDIGLVILDFSDSANSTVIKHLTPLEGMTPNELIINGSNGYAAWGSGGIMKMDFSDPENPSIEGILSGTSGYECRHLQMNGSTLFCFGKSYSDSTLYLIATDTSSGTILDSIDLVNGFLHSAYEAKRFFIDSNYLYLTMGPRGVVDTTELHIFDISNPANITYISSISLGPSSGSADVLQSSHWDLVKRNNYLYIAARFVSPKCNVKIVDVLNPFTPQVVKEWSDPTIAGYSGDIEISENNLILTDQSGGFNVISITNDTSLSLCKRIDDFIPSYLRVNFYMRKLGNYAFLFNLDYYAVSSFDITTPCSAELIDTIPFAHDWKDISVADTNNVFAAVWDFYQLYTINTSNIYAPYISQRTEVFGSGFGIDVKKNYAYMAMGAQTLPLPDETGGLFVYDISTPVSPQKRGWSQPDSGNYDVQVFMDTLSNLAYVIAGQPNSEGEGVSEDHSSINPGLRIVDVSNPNSLVQLGEIHITPQCRGIYKKGDYVYIAASSPDSSNVIDTSGLYIVDVSNSLNPFIAGKWVRTSLPKGHTRAVYVKNNFAFLAHSNKLTVLDISNPDSLSLVNEITLADRQCMDVAGQDNFVFALTENALFAFDISSPSNPIIVDTANGMFFCPARHCDVKLPYIYTISFAGVFIFKFSSVGIFENEMGLKNNWLVYPNPFTQRTVIEFRVQSSELKDVQLQIYDLAGRLVKLFSLTSNPQSPITSVVWDGKNDSGERVCSGVYFYKLNVGDFSQIEGNPKSRYVGTNKLLLFR